MGRRQRQCHDDRFLDDIEQTYRLFVSLPGVIVAALRVTRLVSAEDDPHRCVDLQLECLETTLTHRRHQRPDTAGRSRQRVLLVQPAERDFDLDRPGRPAARTLCRLDRLEFLLRDRPQALKIPNNSNIFKNL